MSKQKEISNEKYLMNQGIDKLIDFVNIKKPDNVFDTVSGRFKTPFPPEVADLARLHKLIRQRKCFTVLEFGLGYSTIIIADALKKNLQDWYNLQVKPEIRNRYMFKLFSVDASLHWIEQTKNRFPDELLGTVEFMHSEVKIGKFKDQLCHYYTQLPDIVPDFIYVDGPAPKDVQGEINGLSFTCDERTVMSADLLLMESTFLPGTFILIDGRTNNARFLQRNFTRNYDIRWGSEEDVTTMELKEERLGPFNLLGGDFFSGIL